MTAVFNHSKHNGKPCILHAFTSKKYKVCPQRVVNVHQTINSDNLLTGESQCLLVYCETGTECLTRHSSFKGLKIVKHDSRFNSTFGFQFDADS